MVPRLIAIALVLLLSGCATFRSWSAETRAEEVTYQTLHVADTLQTLSIARDPDCYFETLSDPLIGRHPSEGMVVAWMAVSGVVHFFITDWLVEHDHPALARTWEAVSIGSSAHWVAHNNSIGLHLFGHNEPEKGTCGEPD